MTRFAFTSGTCVAVVNQPVSWETVSFDVLIAQRRYAGVTSRARLVNRSNAACPISIHMPLALMN
jgi:hypothetical protein